MWEKMDSGSSKTARVGAVGEKTPRKARRRRLRYFYLDGHLHKLLAVVRGSDLCYSWDYVDHKRKMYSWSDVQRRLQYAYNTAEASAMINRYPSRIHEFLSNGSLRPPQKSYSLETGEPGRYWWSEDDMLELHDFFLTVHRGRPRKDGIIVPKALPTRAELKAMMRYDKMIYIKDESGEFIPVWNERIW